MTAETDGVFLARPAEVGPGIRLAVKDLFDTAGLTTTYGSVLFAEHVPTTTAEAVRRLEAAGYANVGKTNLHEFAYGTTSENPHFGTVPNPVAPGRVAGGSSGGNAAALALGLADAALGTDSGGSVRIPAACTGTVGFKPSFGLVPMDGCFPLAPSFDHGGPMARDVETCARMMEALVPGFAREEVARADLRVGIAWLEDADPLIRARVEEAAARFPHARPLRLPFPDGVSPLFQREAADVHRALFPEHADSYGENVRAKLELAFEVTQDQAEHAARLREDYRARIAEAATGVDLVLTPTLPIVAPPVGLDERNLRASLIRFTFPFNALGWPALALPCGPAEDGLPASVQLAAPHGRDALVLAAGAVLEASLQVAARTASS